MSRNNRRHQKKTGNNPRRRISAAANVDQKSIVASLDQASTAINLGKTELAKGLISQILRAAPNHPDALNLKAALLITAGDTLEAVRILTKITNLIPNFAQAHFNLGTALNAMDKPKRALKSFHRALEITPDYADAHYNLANSLGQIDQINEAIIHYHKTLKIEPGHSAAATNLASAHLRLGNPVEALAACELALKSEPGNRDAFAFTAIAASEIGDRQRAVNILNPDLLVRPRQFGSPPGFESLSSFNSALTEHVLAHPTLTEEPHNKATRNGQQTESLALGERGPVVELQSMIGDALDEYLEAIRRDNKHPYPPLIPNLTRIDIWGTVLGAQGHQAAHMHRAAWVSGVYYAKLPDMMRSANNGNVGWIEFGRPPDEFNCKAVHDVRLIEPKEGLMVLFPSYLYHRTIPFESDDLRVSIAFDLLA